MTSLMKKFGRYAITEDEFRTLSSDEKANNFIKNITEAGAIANKKGTITATYTEGEQIYYICSIDDKVVAELCIEEGRATNELNGMFKSWAEKPVFVTPNLKSFETYSER